VSHPFLIWTMQRSGGTALTDLLMEMSEHRSAEHEPFNWSRNKPRQFWPIVEAWNDSNDLKALTRSLAALFADHFLIKHCYELLAMPFNLHLLEAAAETGYRHVHLLRRDETARLVSKFIAEAQGTWFKDYSSKVFAEVVRGDRGLGPLPIERVVDQYRHCRDATATIATALQRSGAEYRLVNYEDLYVGEPAPRRANLDALLTFLGFTADEIESRRAKIEDTLFNAGQNTRAVAPFVPNLDEVVAALSAAGCPGALPVAPLAGEVQLRGPARIVAEFSRMAANHRAAGPYLEIGAGPGGGTVLGGSYFSGAERHAVGAGPATEANGVTYYQGDPNDMRALFGDGYFGTVLWNGALAHDRFFWLTLGEIRRVLAPGGLMMLVVPGFSKGGEPARFKVVGAKGNPIPDTTVTYRVHTPQDYWRISPQAMRQVVLESFEALEVKTAMMPPRIFAVGRKPT
jgi:hypothetical protein